MRRLLVAIAVVLVMAASEVSAQTQVFSRGSLSGASSFDWGVLGPENTVKASPFSSGSVTASTDGFYFLRLDAGSGWNGGFLPGQALLFAGGGSYIDLTFASAITGFATQMWNNTAGPGTFSLRAYSGLSLIATYTRPGAGGGADGTEGLAPLLGIYYAGGFDRIVLSSDSENIYGVEYPNEFAINELTLLGGATVVPEPATVFLLGTGVAGLGLASVFRRRKDAANG